MEIERKYLIQDPTSLPKNYQDFPCHDIEQAYLCTNPVVRVRKDDHTYYLTYKGKGLLAREEYNLPLTEEAYTHLLAKADGLILRKKRFKIPMDNHLVIELDIFSGEYEGLILAEVEFSSIEEAGNFTPPSWFGRDVTLSGEYQNSRLSAGKDMV